MSGSPGVGQKFMPLLRTEIMAGVSDRFERFTTDPVWARGPTSGVGVAVGRLLEGRTLTWGGGCPGTGSRSGSWSGRYGACNRNESRAWYAVRHSREKKVNTDVTGVKSVYIHS